MTEVVLLALPHVQQQVGAVGVGPVSTHSVRQQVVFYSVVIFVHVQLTNAADDTERERQKRLRNSYYGLTVIIF